MTRDERSKCNALVVSVKKSGNPSGTWRVKKEFRSNIKYLVSDDKGSRIAYDVVDFEVSKVGRSDNKVGVNFTLKDIKDSKASDVLSAANSTIAQAGIAYFKV